MPVKVVRVKRLRCKNAKRVREEAMITTDDIIANVVQPLQAASASSASGVKQINLLLVLTKVFDYISTTDQFQRMELADKLSGAKILAVAAIKILYTGDDEKVERYSTLCNEVFDNPYNIGKTVQILMKCADEFKNITELSGPQKKVLVSNVFKGLIQFSQLTQQEKDLAAFAFDGVVEAIIWAKHGGLADVKKGCLKFWNC